MTATMTMTKAENLRRVLRGDEPAWIPFSPNFNQWFEHQRANGTLPEAFAGGDYIDAMKAWGCDIFSRNLEAGTFCEDTKIEAQVIEVETALGLRRTKRYETPHGTLQMVEQEQRDQSTWHIEEYPVKDWEEDLDAICWLEAQRRRGWDAAVFEALADRIGDDGIVNVPVYCTPLKQMHWMFGLDGTCYFAMEDPEEAKRYCDLFWATVWPVLEQLAAHPRVESVILMDNVDAPFYPPNLCEQFWTPYVRQAVELFEPLGKRVWVHACGQLKGLAEEFRRSRVHGLEGISHAPLGDWWVDEAQGCHDQFIFNGGYSPMEQQIADRGEVERFYDTFFARAGRRRFIFSTACNTVIDAPWEHMQWIEEIVRARGGRPASSN